MEKSVADSHFPQRLQTVLFAAIVVLFANVLVTTLWEYRLYFPADFESAFLSGRRYTFNAAYASAFYSHIITGPICIALACFSMMRGQSNRFRHQHKYVGRVQAILALAIMLPSGLYMAFHAYGGPITTWGFIGLTFATSFSLVMAARKAMTHQFASHQAWATRSFLLLTSPLLLRVGGGLAIVTGFESELTYQLNAWVSWLLPLTLYEIVSLKGRT